MFSSLTIATFAHDDRDDTTLSPPATTFYADIARATNEGDENTDQAEGSNAHEESEDEALGAIFSRHIL